MQLYCINSQHSRGIAHFSAEKLLIDLPFLFFCVQDKTSLQKCLTSLAKYPLVIASLEQVSTTTHFRNLRICRSWVIF